MDELEGIRRQMGVLCERGTDCCQGCVGWWEVKGYPGGEGGSVEDDGDDNGRPFFSPLHGDHRGGVQTLTLTVV